MHNKLTLSMTRCIQFGAAMTVLVACSASSSPDDTSSAGATGSASAGKSSGGANSAGAGTPSATAGAAPDAAGSAGAFSSSGGSGSSGVAGSPGNSGAASGGTGGSASGGTGSGGKPGTAGAGTAGTGTAGAGTAGAGTAGSGSAGSGPIVMGGENSVAYIGCSMANNIGVGYKRVGGKVMWNADNYQTGAMVVQNWTDTNSASWKLFDQKMTANGGKDKVKAIMVQICIFSSRATDAELKSMVASARNHVNPGTHIYMVGQPQYEAGHTCSLAGTGGSEWTDEQAKAMAANSAINQDLTYLGKFMLDSTKGEVLSDSCHASSPSGENKLGEQAKAFFGG